MHGFNEDCAVIKQNISDNIKDGNTMGYAFISYSTRNQQMADSFKMLFNRNNIKTWMAPCDIPFGSTYTSTINSAIRGASCFVLLLSESVQGSQWVLRETERAVSTGKTIFTVLLDDGPMNDDFEFMLSTSQAVAIRKIDANDDNIQQLLRTVQTFTQEEQEFDNADSLTYDQCQIYIASDEGSISFASSKIKSFDDENYLDYSGELKQTLTAQLEEFLSCIYQIEKSDLSIEYINVEDEVRLIPSSELRWNIWSLGEDYKIRFRVRHINHDEDLLYDAIHFELSNDLEVSFFKKGYYIHNNNQIIPFGMLGISEEKAVNSAKKLIELCYPNKQIKVQNKFSPKFYNDCSGGYHLYFLLE